MDYLCPLCNSFTSLQENCSRCGQALEDSGRIMDFYGAYSPYQEIDGTKLDNGLPDLLQHQCLHVGWCPSCREERMITVQEWNVKAPPL